MSNVVPGKYDINSLLDDIDKYFDDIHKVRPSAHDHPVIYFVGDSIFRGYGTGAFDLTVEHPAYNLNKIGLMLDMLFEANGRTERVCFSGASLQRLLKISDHCRPGDVIVFEDAGPHAKDYVVLRRYFSTALGMAGLNSGVRVVGMTNYTGPGVDPKYNFSSPLSAKRPETGNDAIRDAAAENICTLIDIEKIFLSVCGLFNAELSSDIVMSDKVHPNIFGHLIYTLSLYKFVVGTVPEQIDVIVDEVEKAWSAIAGNCELGKDLDREKLSHVMNEVSGNLDQYISEYPKPIN